jgi:hypothetical protein
MQIYGADFSGARDPGGGIYFIMGRLSDSTLPVEEAQPCDDRLDLFAAIVESNASWGLDSSFAVPTPAYEPVELSDWQDLLTLASPRRRLRSPVNREVWGGPTLWAREDAGRCNTTPRRTDPWGISCSPWRRA